MSAKSTGYIHSFSAAEQDRLLRQGDTLEPFVFADIDFAPCRTVLEVGCGVGAQLAILARRWPHLALSGIDPAAIQLGAAQAHLRKSGLAARMQLVRGDGARLPFRGGHFDGAFICWVLEHVADPIAVLGEVQRVLQPGGVLYVTEVFNSGLYSDPMGPALRDYWQAFNDYQRELGGDPDVGNKLAHFAISAGFARATPISITPQLDARMRERSARAAFMEYWIELFLSAAPALIAAGRVDTALADAMAAEMRALIDDPTAVFAYRGFQVRAVK